MSIGANAPFAYHAGSAGAAILMARKDDKMGNASATVVASFKKGDGVPEWLMDAGPIKGHDGIPPTITFGCDCHIVETGSQFVIVAERSPIADSYITAGGGVAVAGELYAPKKTVVMPLRFLSFYTAGDTERPDGAEPWKPTFING